VIEPPEVPSLTDQATELSLAPVTVALKWRASPAETVSVSG
jgi:hypothetical protein